MVRLLLNQGVDIEAVDDEGRTANFYASRDGNEEMVSLLMERGADINKAETMDARSTSLIIATLYRYIACVRRLVMHKAINLDASNNGGTVLFWSSWGNEPEITGLLLERGADPTIACNHGERALDKARHQDDRGCAHLLEAALAEPELVCILHKLRSIHDSEHAITKARNDAAADTDEERKGKTIAAAPAYLTGRVEAEEQSPHVKMNTLDLDKEEEKRAAAMEYVTADNELPLEVFVELIDHELQCSATSRGAQFGARTRVGNWQEDICLQEEKYADFRKKKETGKLAIGIRSKRFHLCLQNVPHTFSPDNKLRFGDTVMIENEALKATLVDDPFEEILPQSEKYIVTATPSEVGPTARSTFVITRIPASLEDPVPHIYENTDVLHYGQPFQLTANPSIRVDDEMGTLRPPLYLASTLKTERAASKWSNRQAVYLTERGDYQTVWKLFRPAKAKFDGVTRQFSEYEAVSANEGLTLIHKATSKPLAVDSKYGERTDFGGEWEVTAHAFVGLGKNKVIVAEQYGEATPGSITKPEQNENVWVIKTASSPEAAVDHRKLPPLVTPALVAEHVRKQLANLGHTIAAVKAKIPNNLPKIDIEDAKWIFKELEVPLSDEYLGLWLKTLDKKGNGVLLSSDLLAALQ